MQVAGYRNTMSRIFTALVGLFLVAWGVAMIADYIFPGSIWQIFLALAAILLGVFGKAVYDGRLR
jgi:hypothetical protein